jgi:pyridoxal phosphate enzyme (YggS family)
VEAAALGARLAGVRERIARAAGRARRDPASIRLVAISKTFPSDYIRAAADAGQIDFGENKVQEGLRKMQDVADLPLRWHLVGHLQSNKARKAAQFHAIHSIDDAALLRRVDEAAAAENRRVDVLVQVDLAGEPTKFGVAPEHLQPVLDAARSARAARLVGLMVLPPNTSDAEGARPYFAALRKLRDRLVDEGMPPEYLSELSMGMSHDFEVAVEEGATILRIGSAIFGDRPRPDRQG